MSGSYTGSYGSVLTFSSGHPNVTISGTVNAYATIAQTLSNGTTVATTISTAVYGPAGTVFTVDNIGLLASTAPTPDAFGIVLVSGGTVINAGTIADTAGIGIFGNNGDVQNAGQITASSGLGVYLRNPGTVFNSGVIQSGLASPQNGVDIYNATGALITNAADGFIEGNFGVYLQSGGATLNNAGTIEGAFAGVWDSGQGVSIMNTGTIEATLTHAIDGIVLAGSGNVTNGSAVDTTALIAGNGFGIDALNVTLSGGSFTSVTSVVTVANYGTISGYSNPGVQLVIGAIFNGTALDTKALVNGGVAASSGLIENFGTILSSSTYTSPQGVNGAHDAVNLGTGIFINGSANDTTALVENLTGVSNVVGGQNVINYGSLLGGTVFGVYMASGTLTNESSGIILAGRAGAIVGGFGAATVNNAGVIEGKTGVSAVISQYVYNITVINSGTIASTLGSTGQAVVLGDGNNLLVDVPGAVFIGAVTGGNGTGSSYIGPSTLGTDTLELVAGTLEGTLAGFDSQFFNFSALSVDPGACWDITGTTALASTINVTNSGTLFETLADRLTIDGSLSGAGTIFIDATALALNGAVAAAQHIDFVGTDNLLMLGDAASFTAGIGSFSVGDTIDLTGVSFTSGLSTLGSGNVLTLSENGTIYGLNFGVASNFAGEYFHLSADTAVTGTNIILSATPCFLTGTLIRTPQGEVPVETLKIGDLVTTQSGVAEPVKWLGRRSYRQPFALNNADIMPVLICKNALGAGRPKRDLYVSPLHAIYLDEVLIPARHLVNGHSIRRCPDMPEISYINIELAAHDVIFAEGAAVETFVDCDSRMMFYNAAEFAQLYPHDESPSWAFCAPRVESGPTLRRIWRSLAARAGVVLAPEAATVAGNLIGYIDDLEAERIYGWAWMPEFPHEPVELEILDGDGVIAHVIADRFRPDLVKAGIGDGRHGFEVIFAGGLSAAPHEIHVRQAGGGAALGRSPMILSARPAAANRSNFIRQIAKKPGALEPARALILDVRWPSPGRDAGSHAILSHAAALQRLGHQVDFYATQDDAPPPRAALEALNINCCAVPEFQNVEALLRRQGSKYSVVYMHRLDVAVVYAGLVRALCRGPKDNGAFKIYNVADLHHVRLHRQALIEGEDQTASLAGHVAEDEIFAMRQMNAVITHSPAEAVYLKRLLPDLKLHVVPWQVPVTPAIADAAKRHGIAFIGGFDHRPNQDAVRWLLDEIMPAIWTHDSGMTCQIIGSGWERAALPLLDRRIKLTGAVANLQDIFNEVRLTVAPLRFGAGIKGKVLDSLASGVPCIMTPMAAEGLLLPPPMQALIADSVPQMAEQICGLHDDLKYNREMSIAGRHFMARDYSEEAVVSAMRRLLPVAPHETARPSQIRFKIATK
ncbi:MAG: Hint domain-containing protein [Acidocella sp.]|nr:Hint domain-containing protein [Acidocella sp.]